MDFYEKWPAWLRWVLLLPLSLIFSFLVRWLSLFCYNLCTWGFLDGSFFDILYKICCDGPLIALWFLEAAYKLAPLYKNGVVIFLAFISSLMMFGAFLFAPEPWFSYVGATMIGYIITCIYLCVQFALAKDETES